MPTLLFWNTHRRDLSKLAAALAHDVRADIVVMAECTVAVGELMQAFNLRGGPIYQPDPGVSDRLVILSRYPRVSVVPVLDTLGISIRHYDPPVGLSFLLVAVHLQSKLYATEQDQAFSSNRLARAIQEAEEKMKHSRTILLGDFNMNPFEAGMIAAGGLHATMDRRIALQESRVVQGERHRFFYNPMWSYMGDSRNIPGTYFYNSGTHINFFWNIFDQILIRPAVLHGFTDDSIKVVTEIRDTSLLNSAGRPDVTRFSDHLPIIAKLGEFKREEADVN